MDEMDITINLHAPLAKESGKMVFTPHPLMNVKDADNGEAKKCLDSFICLNWTPFGKTLMINNVILE